MPEKKKTTITPERIADFLKHTGFIFEMRMTELLLNYGYTCEINSSFRDLEGDTDREIDIVASKISKNEINIHFVIECKQSALDKWIFICNQNSSTRYYFAVKHLPTVPAEALSEKKLFGQFHTFDRKIPLGQNYISYSLATEKKSEHLQIDECVYKLPKALIDFASRVGGGRHLFFPVALFSGQIFSVSYDGSLIVQENPFLQYYAPFRSDTYKYRVAQVLDEFPRRTFPNPFGDWEEKLKIKHDNRMKEVAHELRRPYQIDFVTESGLPEYIDMVEKEVDTVRIDDWPLPTPAQEPAQG